MNNRRFLILSYLLDLNKSVLVEINKKDYESLLIYREGDGNNFVIEIYLTAIIQCLIDNRVLIGSYFLPIKILR